MQMKFNSTIYAIWMITNRSRCSSVFFRFVSNSVCVPSCERERAFNLNGLGSSIWSRAKCICLISRFVCHTPRAPNAKNNIRTHTHTPNRKCDFITRFKFTNLSSVNDDDLLFDWISKCAPLKMILKYAETWTWWAMQTDIYQQTIVTVKLRMRRKWKARESIEWKLLLEHGISNHRGIFGMRRLNEERRTMKGTDFNRKQVM